MDGTIALNPDKETTERHTSDVAKNVGEYSTSRAVAMTAHGANQAVIKTVASAGYLVDGVNWVLGFAGLGSEKPFLGHEHLEEIGTDLYNGYYELFGYTAPVARNETDEAFETGGKILGDVVIAAASLGSAYMAQKAAVITGAATQEATRQAGKAFTRTLGSDAVNAKTISSATITATKESVSSLSWFQKQRILHSHSSLGTKIEMLAKDAPEAVQRLLDKAGATGLSDDAYRSIIDNPYINNTIKQSAQKLFHSDTLAATNIFNHAGRSAFYIWNHPGHAALDIAGTVAGKVTNAVLHPFQTISALTSTFTKTAAWVVGAPTAVIATDLALTKGHLTETLADQLPDGSTASTALYTAVNAVRPTDKTTAELQNATNRRSREEALHISQTFKKVKGTAKKITDKLGITDANPFNLDNSTDEEFSILSLLKDIPVLGGFIVFIEKMINLFNEHVKPMFKSADAGNLEIQTDKENRAANIIAKSGHLIAPDATVKTQNHKGGIITQQALVPVLPSRHDPKLQLEME